MWKVTWAFPVKDKWWLKAEEFVEENQLESFVFHLVCGGRILLSLESENQGNYYVPVSIETLRNVPPTLMDLQAAPVRTPSIERQDTD